MRIRVNRMACVGSAICVVDAPTVFEIDELGKAIVVDPHGLTVAPEDLWEAARDCPTQAIVLVNDAGNVLYP
ncbi:MAG: ferredoxin [Chloroflexi bacterium]|nr:ferredoxin [Chloroflexota bacterium]